jgi:hypothetical protein
LTNAFQNLSQSQVDPVNPVPQDFPAMHEHDIPEDFPSPKELLDRLVKLETLAKLHFGDHHFETPAPVFNPQAAADDARARFMREMQEIEAKAKATAN